jgi:hypothetical protein
VFLNGRIESEIEGSAMSVEAVTLASSMAVSPGDHGAAQAGRH